MCVFFCQSKTEKSTLFVFLSTDGQWTQVWNLPSALSFKHPRAQCVLLKAANKGKSVRYWQNPPENLVDFLTIGRRQHYISPWYRFFGPSLSSLELQGGWSLLQLLIGKRRGTPEINCHTKNMQIILAWGDLVTHGPLIVNLTKNIVYKNSHCCFAQKPDISSWALCSRLQVLSNHLLSLTANTLADTLGLLELILACNAASKIQASLSYNPTHLSSISCLEFSNIFPFTVTKNTRAENRSGFVQEELWLPISFPSFSSH